MAEYINRDALTEKLCGACDLRCKLDSMACTNVRNILNAPAADVAPVVHGHWVGLEYDGYADGNPVYDLWECSECGNEERGEDVPETHPFCNWCGARMDGDALEIAIEVLREQEELESDAPEEGGHPNESSDRLAEAFRKFYSKELIEAVTGLFDRRK